MPQISDRTLPNVVFAQEFDEFREAAFFVGAEVIVDVPAEVILAEILGVFGAVADDVVEGVQAELARFGQLTAQGGVFLPAPQCPDGVDKGQAASFQTTRRRDP